MDGLETGEWGEGVEGRAHCEAFELIKSLTTYITGR